MKQKKQNKKRNAMELLEYLCLRGKNNNSTILKSSHLITNKPIVDYSSKKECLFSSNKEAIWEKLGRFEGSSAQQLFIKLTRKCESGHPLKSSSFNGGLFPDNTAV
ncbi:hypothetical protein RFI_15042 [Reticulomyxa filosa]|uniref:Uncharacterized protein n=1 Tax=Reticulomyxa filosa TaxID=46433 RepID=X6N8S6_RETFI|nr:hypothetical protein RFI_15042 [Reticulomyxa filosa]|eukprot:ETO22159.1 hypothetical protein RFI_15042 [Reticulomyxa filosa]